MRDGDRLLLVSDESTDAYYSYALQSAELPSGSSPVLRSFTIDQARLTAHLLPVSAPLDLEGIALLAPATLVVVSETLRSLISADRVLAQYPVKLAEVGNRGIEGVAARRLSDSTAELALLWEGGFLERRDVSMQLATVPGLLDSALKPVICIHTVVLATQREQIESRARPTAIWSYCRSRCHQIRLNRARRRRDSGRLIWFGCPMGADSWCYSAPKTRPPTRDNRTDTSGCSVSIVRAMSSGHRSISAPYSLQPSEPARPATWRAWVGSRRDGALCW